MSVFEVFSDGEPEVSPIWVARVFRLAAWRIQEERLEGRTGVALGACADAIASASDLGRQSLIGSMIGTGLIDAGARPCAAAVESGSAAERRMFEESARVARKKWPAFGRILEKERLFLQLGFFGSRVSERARARLPPEAGSLLRRDKDLPPPFERTSMQAVRCAVFGGYAYRRYVEQYGQLIDAAALPPREAAQKYDELHEMVELADVLTANHEVFGEWKTMWAPFHARVLQGEAMLDGLIALAEAVSVKEQGGTWPVSWDFLQSAPNAHPVRCPNTGSVLPLAEEGTGAWLVIPASDGREDSRPVAMGRM